MGIFIRSDIQPGSCVHVDTPIGCMKASGRVTEYGEGEMIIGEVKDADCPWTADFLSLEPSAVLKMKIQTPEKALALAYSFIELANMIRAYRDDDDEDQDFDSDNESHDEFGEWFIFGDDEKGGDGNG